MLQSVLGVRIGEGRGTVVAGYCRVLSLLIPDGCGTEDYDFRITRHYLINPQAMIMDYESSGSRRCLFWLGFSAITGKGLYSITCDLG